MKVCVQNIPVLNSRDPNGMTNSSHTQTSNVSCSAVKDMCKQSKYVDQSSQTVDPNREQCLCVDLLSEFDNMKINFEIILTRGDAPDSSTVPNTASNAKDHGNAPRRLVRDCEILCLFLGKSVNFSANA